MPTAWLPLLLLKHHRLVRLSRKVSVAVAVGTPTHTLTHVALLFAVPEAIKPASLDAARSLFETPKDKAAEPEEEGRGLKILHTLVGDLAAEMKTLTQEIATLEARMAKLEAARRR
jgi:uncharacterized small protein (DUF1192 family)